MNLPLGLAQGGRRDSGARREVGARIPGPRKRGLEDGDPAEGHQIEKISISGNAAFTTASSCCREDPIVIGIPTHLTWQRLGRDPLRVISKEVYGRRRRPDVSTCKEEENRN